MNMDDIVDYDSNFDNSIGYDSKYGLIYEDDISYDVQEQCYFIDEKKLRKRGVVLEYSCNENCEPVDLF